METSQSKCLEIYNNMWNVQPVKDVFDCQRIVSFEGIVFFDTTVQEYPTFLIHYGTCGI